jgi:DNA-binding response OmpR family regulator
LVHDASRIKSVVTQTIAVIEDDATIANAVAERLRREGMTVEVAADGPSGVELCRRIDPDLVVLDLMLPGLDGLEVCRQIQQNRPVLVLMLTARDSETDVLVGLGVGADDYMTKPFSVREVVARVHALLRRQARSNVDSTDVLRVGETSIDAAGRKVTHGDKEVHLTATEFDLLLLLAKNRGRVFTRDQLLEQVWGISGGWSGRTVDTHVASLRRKLDGSAVRTVHGVGYALGDDE